MDPFERAKELFLEGVSYFENKQFGLAESRFNESLALVPDRLSTMTNLAATLIQQKKFGPAKDLCSRCIAIESECADAWHYLGVIDCEELNNAGALEKLDRALGIDRNDPAIHNSRGVVLRKLKRIDEAMASYDRAIALKPDFVDAYYNRGQALEESGRPEETRACYERALGLQPEYEYLYGTWLHLKMRFCDWSDLESQTAKLASGVEKGEKITPPFPVLALSASMSLQRKAAQIWVENSYPEDHSVEEIPMRPESGAIRIGYFSSDFGTHVVSLLTAGLFEAHDKDRFKIIALSYGADAGGPMRFRLQSAFDEFIDVGSRTDAEVARLSRDLGIDIAIDLGGHTKGSRTGIFARRAAPIQLNYIGYPGTMGAPYIDYIIGDRNLVPEELKSGYAEKIAYLRCFQANDPKREISEKSFTREELGIPEAGVVFCCFNNNYKITPDVFDAWMTILANVEGSSLLLYGDNVQAERNLRNEAHNRGVAPGRIVFGKRLATPEYLARYRAADLFLDTFPFNGGATVSDALWSGLPVLTRSGESFASRMGAALLNAVDMPELVAGTRDSYIALAVALATDPGRLKETREKLARDLSAKVLFDTALFTRQLEAAYTEMYRRYRAGLPPEHIYVPV